MFEEMCTWGVVMCLCYFIVNANKDYFCIFWSPKSLRLKLRSMKHLLLLFKSEEDKVL